MFRFKSRKKDDKRKKIKIHIKKHYKDITETNKVIALEEEDSSSPSAPSEEEAEFLPPAKKKVCPSSKIRPLDHSHLLGI